jgi:hypothetical protein
MKIEIGESLVYTWLRHIKGCQVVQNNWKSSSQWQLLGNKQVLQTLMDEVDSLFSSKGYDLFKSENSNKKVSLDQVLKQTESDAMGISISNNEVYGVDIAFHTRGVGYDNPVKKVLAKYIRIAMCVYGYFNRKDAHIVFASPKMHQKDKSKLIVLMDDLRDITNRHGFSFDFQLFVDNDFQKEILDRVLGKIKSIADTSELFTRSVQLLHMFYNCSSKQVASTITNNGSGTKIGQYARQTLTDLLRSKKLTPANISNLEDPAFCINTLGMRYPVLVDVRKNTPEKGRYYKPDRSIYPYVICNDWYEKRNRSKFEAWLATID